MARSYYDILGVPKDADEKTIKKAFRKLASEHHPDRNKGDKQAEERFKEINRAYEVLGDADKRSMYDEFGEDAEKIGFDPDKARQYRQWQAAGAPGAGGGIDLEDLLAQMFGGGGPFRNGADPFAGGAGGPFHFGGGRGPRKGRDTRASLAIDFETAARGGERILQIDGRSLTVRIPAGVDDGGTLRLRGQGAPGAGGAPAGDLLLTLSVAPHPVFERDGLDLQTTVPITLGEALRGAQVEVPTLDGRIRVKVPRGAQPGQVLRVRGKGIHPKNKPAGDLLVSLDLKLPTLGDRDVDAHIDAIEALYDQPVR